MSDKPLSIRSRTRPRSAWAWWVSLRPRSLAASFGPLLLALGVAVATGDVRTFAILPVLVGGLLLHAGANLANDYFDHRQGADPSLGRGQTFSQPRLFLAGALVAMASALSLAAYLVLQTGWTLVVFALAAVLLGIEYTAPPLRLNYRGAGEVAAFLLFGPALSLGAYDALTGALAWSPALAAIPSGLVTAAVLFANNVRDISPDEISGKRTLAVRLGPRRSKVLLAMLLLASPAALLILALSGGVPRWTLITLLAAPVSVMVALRLLTGRATPEEVMDIAYRLGLAVALLMGAAYLLA